MVVLFYLVWDSSFGVFIHIFPMPITITTVTMGFVRCVYFTIIFFKVHKNYIFHSFPAIRTLHKMSILFNKSVLELLVNLIPHNFCAELCTAAGGEGIAVIACVLKRNNIFIFRKKLFKRKACTLDSGIDAEETCHKVASSHDVNAHCKIPFRFFLYIL